MRAAVVSLALMLSLACSAGGTSVDRGSEAANHDISPAVALDPGILAYSSEKFSIWLNYERGLRYAELVFEERDPTTDLVYTTRRVLTLAYPLAAAATRANGTVFLCGTDSGGSLVIERFDPSAKRGAYEVRVDELPYTSIGQPAATTEVQEALVNGIFLPPDRRGRDWLTIDREVIHSDPFPGDVVGLGADPEGRYVLAITESDEVYRFENTHEANYVLLYDASSSPSMPFLKGSMKFFEHAVDKRVCLLWTRVRPLTRIALSDYDNDGVFDAITEYPVLHEGYVDPPQTFEQGLIHDYGSHTN